MLIRLRSALVCVAAVVALTFYVPDLQAQISTSSAPQRTEDFDDVSPDPFGPGSTAPRLIPDLRVPAIDFVFDLELDPSGGTDATRMTDAARNIIKSHMIAQQQVELAIQFLEANRDRILAGQSDEFNRIYGNVGELRPVAILEPFPVAFGSVGANGFLVQASQQGARSRARNVGQQQRGGGGAGQNQSVTLCNQINKGDFIFFGDPNSPIPPQSSRVAQIDEILGCEPVVSTQGQGGGGRRGGGQGQNQTRGQNAMLVLDSRGTGIQASNVPGRGGQALANQPIHRVLRFELRPDTTTYDRVLDTFKAIRRGLAGLDPTDELIDPFADNRFNRQDVQYNAGFRDMASVWAPGDGEIPELNGLLNLNAGLPANTLIADRLVRQAGFSSSDSAENLQRQRDIASGATNLPLLWTEDNALPTDFTSNVPISDAQRKRAFYLNKQTIFGEPDNPFNQFVGRAFINERVRFFTDFFDNSVAALDPPRTELVAARDANGNLVRDNNGNVVFVEVTVPRTAGRILSESPTEFRQWQMIVQSFAEHSTDFTNFTNVAAFGVMEIVRGTADPTTRALDAGNFARFADLIRNAPVGGPSGFDLARLEPLGKRALAGFFPVVPRF